MRMLGLKSDNLHAVHSNESVCVYVLYLTGDWSDIIITKQEGDKNCWQNIEKDKKKHAEKFYRDNIPIIHCELYLEHTLIKLLKSFGNSTV